MADLFIFDFDNRQKSNENGGGSGKDSPVFKVVRMSGDEGISQLYSYDVLLAVSGVSDLQAFFGDMMKKRVLLTVMSGGKTRKITGIVSECALVGTSVEYLFVSARIVPKITMLNESCGSEVFLDKSVPDIINEIISRETSTYGDVKMDSSGLTSNNYQKIPMVSRFNESPWAFVCRLMERYGIYFYFDFPESAEDDDPKSAQGVKYENLVLSDRKSREAKPDIGEFYAGVKGINDVMCFTESKTYFRRVPQKAGVSSYDLDKTRTSKLFPANDMDVQISPTYSNVFEGMSSGTAAEFESGFNSDQCEFFASISAERKACASQESVLAGTCPLCRPGIIIGFMDILTNRETKDYLIKSVHHSGCQSGFGFAGLGDSYADQSYYKNDVTAIPSDLQFRPALKTPVPKMYGFIPAIVEGEDASSFSPIMDNLGRYRIKLPYDSSSNEAGQSSCWVKFMTPYGGNVNNIGMHFPLLKDTQVMIGFIDGDVDKPFIAGTLQDAGGSIIKAELSNVNMIRTPGGNYIAMGDGTGPGTGFIVWCNSNGYRTLGKVPDSILNSF